MISTPIRRFPPRRPCGRCLRPVGWRTWQPRRTSCAFVVGRIHERACGPCAAEPCERCPRAQVVSVPAFRELVGMQVDEEEDLFIVHAGLGATADEAAAIRPRVPMVIMPAAEMGEIVVGHGNVAAWQADNACVAIEVRDLGGRVWLDETVCEALPEALRPVAAPPPEVAPASPREADGCAATASARPSPIALLALLGLVGLRRRSRRRPVERRPG